jgi:pimeloyl-ACP methyl ester carboxylesterase
VNDRSHRFWRFTRTGCAGVALLLAGCSSPIGVEEVPTRKAYDQVEANALSTGQPSAETTVILDRYQLGKLADKSPEEVIRQLHAKAVATGERDLLFALAEISYLAGDHFSRQAGKPGAPDPRDYYLGASVYAWLFLFGEGSESASLAFDRRFRTACDLYNYGLGLAFAEGSRDGRVMPLEASRRRLPVGEISLAIDASRLPIPLATFEEIRLADRYLVRGLRVRNRRPGVGAPLICVSPVNPKFDARPCVPVTALLRGPTTLAALEAGRAACTLELYPAVGATTVEIDNAHVPLEVDLTTTIAYSLNDSTLWQLGSRQFREPAKKIDSQLLLAQPYDPARIPVVFVHGTFSSPLTWVEMTNTLAADPILRRRYQLWSFIYGSGNPLIYSMGDLRAALLAKVREVDPAGTNPQVREMVLIGHSQGGLLVKSTVVETGDKLWRAFSAKPFDDPGIPDTLRPELQRLLFLQPLPFVRRVVFIATPHRGGYLNHGIVRSLGQWLVSLPGDIVSSSKEMLKLTEGTEAEAFLEGKVPTSVDGMSPKNPALLALADIPVAPSVTAHSIIAVEDDDNPAKRRDGIVSYESAHVDYAQSEFIVNSPHTCLNHPATIEEVRRILHLHLQELDEANRAATVANP